ncbi:MAG: pantothenate kinase [Pseudomonas sp.]|uniref:pantothenate kinase n=1 Tax=Pseudomonadota TaxID=1224 RepID=UPI00272393D3|nr:MULTISPECIES: pantothenate kinase [Pseudomonadota]MDO9619604.1 pantothenate kinase [Pseudomonas sp.]MDP2443965.1 pantothenate kinase [Pseudomonas sp.]MDZ4284020.1 pantothenate kinase [Hydrogenophaga sp.]
MILELDCGNTFIKWRLLGDGEAAKNIGGVVDSDQALIEVVREQAVRLRACRLVSVRSDEETAQLISLIELAFAVTCHAACPAVALAGVRNGYEQYERLGLDRWLAVVGAYQLSHKAALIIDLGTAVTSDFVAADGAHLGGFICPGVPLMRTQLRTHTRRTRYDSDEAARALENLVPGRATAEAVERGCLLMLRGFVTGQLAMAAELLGRDVDVFLTGGDAPLVVDVIPGARVVPDLVFIGLAIACPIG